MFNPITPIVNAVTAFSLKVRFEYIAGKDYSIALEKALVTRENFQDLIGLGIYR